MRRTKFDPAINIEDEKTMEDFITEFVGDSSRTEVLDVCLALFHRGVEDAENILGDFVAKTKATSTIRS